MGTDIKAVNFVNNPNPKAIPANQRNFSFFKERSRAYENKSRKKITYDS